MKTMIMKTVHKIIGGIIIMPLARVCKVLGACKLDQYLRMSPPYCSPHFPTSFNVAVFCYYALKTNIYTLLNVTFKDQAGKISK